MSAERKQVADARRERDLSLAKIAELEVSLSDCLQLARDSDFYQSELAKCKLTWTSEEPTESGWYWVKSTKGHVEIISFQRKGEFLKSVRDKVNAKGYISWGYQFAGPLQSPQENGASLEFC